MVCRSGMLKSETNGVAGYFEDIPSIIVVILGVGIFIGGLLSSYAGYTENKNKLSFRDECYQLARSLRTYKGLIHEESNTPGVFDSYKISTLTDERITKDLAWKYPFRVVVIDISDYDTHYNLDLNSTDPSPPTTYTEKVVVSSYVNIFVQHGEMHAARMIVSVWRV